MENHWNPLCERSLVLRSWAFQGAAGFTTWPFYWLPCTKMTLSLVASLDTWRDPRRQKNSHELSVISSCFHFCWNQNSDEKLCFCHGWSERVWIKHIFFSFFKDFASASHRDLRFSEVLWHIRLFNPQVTTCVLQCNSISPALRK